MQRAVRLFMSDFIGIGSAALCAVHCLAAPVLLTLFHSSEWFHAATYVFLVISIYAAYQSTKTIQDKLTKSLIWTGLAALTLMILFEEQYHWMHDASYAASFVLIAGHVRNIKQGASCRV